MNEPTKIQLTEIQKKRQRTRNIAIAFTLAFLVVIFYAVTIVKLGPGVMDRPL